MDVCLPYSRESPHLMRLSKIKHVKINEDETKQKNKHFFPQENNNQKTIKIIPSCNYRRIQVNKKHQLGLTTRSSKISTNLSSETLPIQYRIFLDHFLKYVKFPNTDQKSLNQHEKRTKISYPISSI